MNRLLLGRMRLASGLVLLAFLTCHLLNHAVLLISPQAAQRAANILLGPWIWPGLELVLPIALLWHMGNAVVVLYRRRSLRLKGWEWWQLGLGLALPPLLMTHLLQTAVGGELYGFQPTYSSVLLGLWASSPWQAGLQALLLLTAWAHGMLGLAHWLKTFDWYPRIRTPLMILTGTLPALAMAGFVSGGLAILRAVADDPTLAEAIPGQARIDPVGSAVLSDAALLAQLGWCGLVGAIFLIRAARTRSWRLGRLPVATLPDGRGVPIRPGASLLESFRANGVAWASVCGGRGRCTTCRLRVVAGLERLEEPGALEGRALARIGAAPGVRLACQLRPSAALAVVPLLPPQAGMADGRRPGGLEGQEKAVTCLFLDLRGSTKLGESRLPYDVLFLLNQFFAEMTEAIAETRGLYAQFNGDGLMALYGLSGATPAQGARDALRGARAMLDRLDRLNAHLAQDLAEPLRMGIGIHHGEAIVGAMGPPQVQMVSAIGDTVNTAARLETASKEFERPLVISEAVFDAAEMAAPPDAERHSIALRGRAAPIAVYALAVAPDIGR